MTNFNDPDALVEWFDEQLHSLRNTDHPMIDPEDFEKIFDMVLREIPRNPDPHIKFRRF